MPLVFKLVGTNINKEYIIKEEYTGNINIDILNKILISWNFINNEIEQIKFIRNGSQILKDNYLILSNIEEYIFIFSNNEKIREKLKNVFENYQLNLYKNDDYENLILNDTISNILTDIHIISDDENHVSDDFHISDDENHILDKKNHISDDENKILDKKNLIFDEEKHISDNKNQISDKVNHMSDEEKHISDNIITQDIINNINEETIILFRDPDFRILIDIYKRRPDLFQKLLQYTYSGDIEYNINKIDDYSLQLTKIKELNLNLSDEKINDKLKKYGGHLNLTLRALLCEL
jgi:hypothetical protein